MLQMAAVNCGLDRMASKHPQPSNHLYATGSRVHVRFFLFFILEAAERESLKPAHL